MRRTTVLVPCAVLLAVVGAPLAQASAASWSRTPLVRATASPPVVPATPAPVTGHELTPAPTATPDPAPVPSPTSPAPSTAPPATAPTPAPVLAPPAPTRSPYYGRGSTWDANEPQRRLAIYGDSLVMQTKPLLSALAGTRATAIDVWELPGAAPCDLLPQYGSRMKAFGTQRVELAFVGNATSACMTSRTGGRPPGVLSTAQRQRIAGLYAADLSALIRWNRNAGVLTYLVLPPAMARGTWHGQLTASLTSALTRLAAQHPGHVRLNGAPRDALTPGGVYRQTTVLNGRTVQLRHRDGTHLFAPVGTTLNAQALLWPLALEP